MKRTILIQLDADPQPSVFDAVVAVDAGVEILFRHGAVTPEQVEAIVHGAIFTRGGADLARTAIFIGGSDVAAAESIRRAVERSFFGPFRVSVLFDPNGCNTTAAAAVLAAEAGAKAALGDGLKAVKAAVLGATGPVGQRVARLLMGLGADVRVGSRNIDRARALAEQLNKEGHGHATPFSGESRESLICGLRNVQVAVAAGAAGAVLLPAEIRRDLPALKIAIDLNAVPPAGIEGIQPADKQADRDGVMLGRPGRRRSKMKIHRKAIESLFTANDRRIDAEQCLEIGRV
ncbi:MAG: NAD(P)-dependent methylenetetrahydromethanopterin dehydrogenase [Isosphaeraceae bacterium]